MHEANELKTLISELSPVEVFDYYDGPKFYSCRDIVGQLFIVYWIEDDEYSNSWLYLKISQERYAALKNGKISIANALSNPEEKFAFFVKNFGNKFEVNKINENAIDSEWLPVDNDFLNIATPTLPEKTSSTVELAIRSKRETLDLAFDKANNEYEMGCGKLGRILNSIQNLIYALACPIGQEVNKIPEDVKYKSEVSVTGLFASSFGVRLQSNCQSLLNDSEIENAIRYLVALIDLLEDPEKIYLELKKFNTLTRSRFKNFLNILIDSQVSMKTEWGSPSGKNANARASFDKIKRALTKLEQTDDATKNTIEIIAELVGVDIENSFFALKNENKELIKGRLSKSVSSRQFDIPSRIWATIEVSCTIDPLTDKEKWSHTLLDFKTSVIE